MVINHKINKAIASIKKEHLVGFFEESRNSIEILTALRDAFDAYEEGSMDADGLYETVSSSEIQAFYAEIYYLTASSFIPSISKHAMSLCKLICEYNEKVKYFNDNFLYLEDSDIATFRNYTYTILAGLLFIIYFDFHLDDIVAGNEDIDEIYDYYCKQNDLVAALDAIDVNNLRRVYRLKVDIFDEYPEYEDAYDAIVGPYRFDIDEEQLTIEHVKRLVSGEIDVFGLIREVPASEGALPEDMNLFN